MYTKKIQVTGEIFYGIHEPLKSITSNSESQRRIIVVFVAYILNYVFPQSLGSAGNSNIHPAVIKLGVQYAKGIICGSNARCVALLLAFKKVRNLT